MYVTLVLKNVLMNMVIFSFTARHKYDCIIECFWSRSCRSFLFEDSTKTCHFCNKIYAGNLSWFIPQHGTDYYVYDTPLDTYDSVPGCRYKIHPEKRTWVDARQVCLDEGGDLATPKTHIQREFYMNLLYSGLFLEDVFVGGERPTGVWKWVDGTDVGTDFNISATRPAVQDCLELDRSRRIFAERCNDTSEKQPFVCEYR